jgi:glycosyltransferase involved in cell wall biosynthesis
MDDHVVSFTDWIRGNMSDVRYVLSLKPSEMSMEDCHLLFDRLQSVTSSFVLVLHEFLDSELEHHMLVRADRILTVDNEMAERVRAKGHQVVNGYAPAALRSHSVAPNDLTFLVLGMSHKMNQLLFDRFVELCETSGESYSLEVSMAVHEGQNLGEAFDMMEDLTRSKGSKVRFLGFLSDEALARAISDSDGIVLLREGIRESNSSVLAAMSFGKPAFVWLDALSPPWMSHGVTVFDVGLLTNLPDSARRASVGAAGRDATRDMTFAHLGALLRTRAVLGNRKG